MPREAMRLRRTDRQGAALRPTDNAPVTRYDSALRADYVYVDSPLGPEETFLNVDNLGYDAADLRFSPDAVVAKNPFTTYGSPTAYDIVRSPDGVPVTNQDGYLVARYDLAATIVISSVSVTSNVVTVTTATAHGFTVGQTVNVRIGGAQASYSGAYVISSTPLTTTFTYALTTANLGTTTQTNAYCFVVGINGGPLAPGQNVRTVDQGLIAGQFYYYGLFARYFFQGNTYWLRVANSELLVPFDYGCGDRLWDMIPEFYRRLDTEHVGNSAQQGVLRRFVDVWGYELDVQRTWNSTVGDVWDAGRINARLLKQLGDALGHGTNEAVLGDKRYRNLLANLLYLRKLRGTKDGVEGWLQATTGYKILTYIGKNLMLDNNATEFRNSLGPLANSTQGVLSLNTVTNKALTTNVATLTTGSAHGFVVGQTVSVANVDSTFDGSYAITAVTSTTFSYAKTASNVTSVAVAAANPQAIATIGVGTVARITSAGEAGGPPSGAFYARYTQPATAGLEGHMRFGSTSGFGTSAGQQAVQTTAVPVVAGRQYRFSSYVISSTASLTFLPRFEWYDSVGNALSVSTATGLTALVSWSQLSSDWMTAPTNAAFCIPVAVISNMASAGTFAVWRTMFTDRSWLPTGQVALYGDPPTAWEASRVVHVSLYPQRTNYAINADFSQNPGSFPNQGWVATDPATYDTLPFAYSTYDLIYNRTVSNKALTSNVATLTTTTAHGLVIGDVVTVTGVDATFNGTFTVTTVPTSTTFTYAKVATNVTSVASGGNVSPAPENSYNDLLAGYDTLSNSTTLTFTPAGMTSANSVPGYMTVATSVAPYSGRASSIFFPVVQQTAFSARVIVLASIANTQVRVRIRWYTANNAGAEIVGTDYVGQYVTAPVWTSGSMVGGAPAVVFNAQPPATALWARVIVETQGTATNSVYVTYAIFEDAAVPGPWFDGNTTESAFGDYRFTGTAYQSYSAFYQNYNAVMNGLSSADRLHSMLPELIPPDRDYTFHSVQNGLL